MSIADQIKAARLAAELSQSALARASGMEQSDISKIEKGERHPGPGVIGRIAEALGTTFEEDDDVSDTTTEFSTDLPPQPKKAKATTKKAGPRHAKTAMGISLQDQLAFPYHLLGDVAANRLPMTSNMLHAQAPVCAAAWDQFLLRYPSLREKIEQGMVATDIVMLIMAHVPIVQAMREETQRLAQQQEWDASASAAA